MDEIITRIPHTTETPALRKIWKEVFGRIGEEAFFTHYYDPKLCIIAEIANTTSTGTPTAAGYLVPFGKIVHGKKNIPCVMIYSIATLPEHRGMGLGTAIVHNLVNLAREQGYPAVVLCPADDELFDYYNKRTELRDWFFIIEQTLYMLNRPAADNNIEITEISTNEYSAIREDLLKEIIHIKHDLPALEYQALLCKELGGGLFRIGQSCAVVERQTNEVVWIKELLIADNSSDTAATEVITSITYKFPANEYIIRSPASIYINTNDPSIKQRRFGMLTFSKDIQNDFQNNKYAPWYGLAFD